MPAANDCTHFLQDVLPRLRLRWPGFRKPRGQVCKRIRGRLGELRLGSLDAYRAYLDDHEDEWRVLDFLCRVTISRFRRDRGLWQRLEDDVLPGLARSVAADPDDPVLRIWCAGCASGEEPYSLALSWQMTLAERFRGVRLRILATDFDPHMLFRARRAVYPRGSLRELPDSWRTTAFGSVADSDSDSDSLRLKAAFRRPVRFAAFDLRTAAPRGPFHAIFCRNIAFTYFDEALQQRTASRLASRLSRDGVLVLGAHETLPGGAPPIRTLSS